MRLTGAQIIMECLLEQKVDTVFGYPGGAVLNIYDALYEYQDRINHICTAHEQGAAHAADGYARASGKTGVCIATSGPGATNLVTGSATAYMDSVPMVAITGNVNLNLLGLDSFQEVDITGITMPITKHNFIVKKVENLADTLRHAFRIANEGRKGPVLVDIPKDITGAICEFTPRDITQPFDEQEERRQHLPVSKPLPIVKEAKLEKALKLIAKSQRPFLYAGGGVISSGCEEELAALAEKLDAPVSCSLMCQGGYNQGNDRYMGMLGMHGTMTAAQALKHCDLFIAVGTRFSDRVLCNSNLFARHCPIIQIDIDPAEFDKQIDISVKLGGDAKVILQALLERTEQQNHSAWMEQIARWKVEYPLTQKPAQEGAVTPQALMETLRKLTDDKDIITTEVGQHQMWAAQYLRHAKSRGFITSGGLGTMGFGYGAAIGAQMALGRDQRVVMFTGDGSFHMNLNEACTAVSYELPIITVIFNNSVLGMVRQWQTTFYEKRYSQTDPHRKTDFVKLAEGFGLKGYRCTNLPEFQTAFADAMKQKGPTWIECIIDKDEKVLPMIPGGGDINDIIME